MKVRRKAEVYVTRLKDWKIRFQMPQGDTGREIELLIADMDVPTNATARIYVKKPSGKEVFNAATVNGQSVIISVTNQILAEEGSAEAQVQLISGSDIISTFRFLIEVEKNIASSSAIESSNEYNLLDTTITEAQEAIKTMDGVLDNIGNTPISFSPATARANISTGESIKTVFGKLAKWFADLKTVAFSGSYNDLSNRPTLGTAAARGVSNALTQTADGYVLDARQGKVLKDGLDTLNSALSPKITEYTSLKNGWITNGLCCTAVIGKIVFVRMGLKGGTVGTEIELLSGLPKIATGSAVRISGASDVGYNGYTEVKNNSSGVPSIFLRYITSNTNVMFEFFYLTT